MCRRFLLVARFFINLPGIILILSIEEASEVSDLWVVKQSRHASRARVDDVEHTGVKRSILASHLPPTVSLIITVLSDTVHPNFEFAFNQKL